MKFYSTLFVIIFNLVLSQKVVSQIAISYTEPLSTYNSTPTQVIGKIGDRILVCYTSLIDVNTKHHDLTANIISFDNKMNLINSTEIHENFANSFQYDFINQTDSFSLLIQYKTTDSFYCKMISFNGNGKILHTKYLIKNKIQKDDSFYIVINSAQNNSFVMFTTKYYIDFKILSLEYIFIVNGTIKNLNAVKMPYDQNYSQIGQIFLENSNLLTSIITNNNIALYKLNLNDNNTTNTLRALTNGTLNSSTVSINAEKNSYNIVAQAKSTGLKKNLNNIFLWKLNKDLSDAAEDTVYFDNHSLNLSLRDAPFFTVNSFNDNKNHCNILISSIVNVNTSNPSGPLISSINSFDTYTANIVYNGEFQGLPNFAIPSGTAYHKTPVSRIKLVAVNIDSGNNIAWVTAFDQHIEYHLTSFVNQYKLINAKDGAHIFYLKHVGKRESIGEIILYPNGKYIIEPIIFRKVNLKFSFSEAVQADNNSLLIPCNDQGKLIFIKLSF